jgi:16S rRNA (cytosine1402-N4)-methyltransferase
MHQPVLYKEIIHALRPESGKKYIDCTVGAGGHATAILEASSPGGELVGLDVDPQALALAEERLAPFGDRAILRKSSYTHMRKVMDELGWQRVDGIVIDLGVSSMQLDTAERGFSFRASAPLDMRFDPDQEERASDLVNQLPEAELADILYRYGEERRSRQVARAIVAARPIYRTDELAQIVKKVVRSSGGIHPATRTFQALRIATNQEMDRVEQVLPVAVDNLAAGGRLAVIAFHSLEDRIVKQYFRKESRDCICPPGRPICVCRHQASITLLTRKPIRPTEEEMVENPRARSARLRVAEKR